VRAVGADCCLDTVLALESCYLALLRRLPDDEVARITAVMGRFSHGSNATGTGNSSAAQFALGRFHNTTVNKTRGVKKASAARRQQVCAVFASLLGTDAVPSPDVTRIEQPLRDALHEVAFQAFRLWGVQPHAPCPEPKAAAVLLLAWEAAGNTAVSISRDALFIPHLEESMVQPDPPKEMHLTLLALQAADMPEGMAHGLYRQIMDILRPMVLRTAVTRTSSNA
jgi:hypothetical protein